MADWVPAQTSEGKCPACRRYVVWTCHDVFLSDRSIDFAYWDGNCIVTNYYHRCPIHTHLWVPCFLDVSNPCACNCVPLPQHAAG